MQNQPIQHPATIRCALCQQFMERAGTTPISIRYSCPCGNESMEMIKPFIRRDVLRPRTGGQRIPVRRGGPDNAA